MKFALFASVVSAVLVAGAQSPRADFVLDILGQRVTPDESANTDASGIPGGVGGGTVGGLPNSSGNLELTSLGQARTIAPSGSRSVST
jgi:hypothetical protein